MFSKDKKDDLTVSLMFYIKDYVDDDCKGVYYRGGCPHFKCYRFDENKLDELCERLGVEWDFDWDGNENHKAKVWLQPIGISSARGF